MFRPCEWQASPDLGLRAGAGTSEIILSSPKGRHGKYSQLINSSWGFLESGPQFTKVGNSSESLQV